MSVSILWVSGAFGNTHYEFPESAAGHGGRLKILGVSPASGDPSLAKVMR